MTDTISLHLEDVTSFVRVQAPVCVPVELRPQWRRAAEEGRLLLIDHTAQAEIPVQWYEGSLWFIAPPRPLPQRVHLLIRSSLPRVVARRDRGSRQLQVEENGRPLLQYNYWTVDRPERHAQVSPENRIYSRPRSNYIHPLYGLSGEVMTEDWPLDHPHHRGIYWAWPEVDYRDERGDLHALQRVFAYPTGRYRVTEGPVFAQIEAESLWRWEGQEAIVHEWAVFRAYRSTSQGRCIDLTLYFTALKEGVQLARRGTNLYGGLNMRLATIGNQRFEFHTEGKQAWAGAFGVFPAGRQPTGLLVFPHTRNPYHPPDWVQYPELNWLQPTFPAANVRYALHPGKPLTLRYRLWVVQGGEVRAEDCLAQWRAYHASVSEGGAL